MSGFRLQLLPSVFFAIALAILLALGTWQIDRMSWKNKLIETIKSQAKLPPQALPPKSTWKQLDPAKLEYRTFEARGTFDLGNEIHLFTHTSPSKTKFGGAGYLLIVPFRLNAGGTVLVNRGFVPENLKDRETRLPFQLTGEQKITGLVQLSQGVNYFTPKTNFKKNIWYTRDINAFAKYLNLPEVAPFIITITKNANDQALPLAREPKITLANNHLGYALTWYGLALALCVVFVVFSRKDPNDGN